MASTAVVNLDWRSSPESKEILNAIQRLFADGDSEGEMTMIFSKSLARGIINLELVDNVLMVTRQGRTYKRKVTNQVQYWAKLLDVATTLYNMQVDRQALNSRFLEYKEIDPEMQGNLPVVKRKTLDLALTIGAHPAALGIVYEEIGKVHLPQKVTVETLRVTDVFAFNNRDKSAAPQDGCTSTKLSPGENAIPRSVVKLRVNISLAFGAVLSAVIVVEHRNLEDMITNHQFAMQDVVVVMTAGPPSGATKEFLHLLCNDPALQNIPFLYFADHDMQGFSIFQTLKYGSRNSAWASASMVCPRLQYVGPTKEDLLESVQEYRPLWKQAYRQTHPQDTPGQAQKKEHKVKSKFDGKTPKDNEMYTAFKNIGWMEYEPLAKREIEKIMGSSKAASLRNDPSRLLKFRLADLTVADPRYLRQYFQAKLQEYCLDRRTVDPETPAVESQRLPSQASSNALAGGRVTRNTSALDESDAANPFTGGAPDLSPGAQAIEDFARYEIP
ncbi:MAG: hypothetical protein Q9210_000662 [Variospora velana]